MNEEKNEALTSEKINESINDEDSEKNGYGKIIGGIVGLIVLILIIVIICVSLGAGNDNKQTIPKKLLANTYLFNSDVVYFYHDDDSSLDQDNNNWSYKNESQYNYDLLNRPEKVENYRFEFTTHNSYIKAKWREKKSQIAFDYDEQIYIDSSYLAIDDLNTNDSYDEVSLSDPQDEWIQLNAFNSSPAVLGFDWEFHTQGFKIDGVDGSFINFPMSFEFN